MNISAIPKNDIESDCSSKNTNNLSTPEGKSSEFDLMLEINDKNLISLVNNITENEIILNQTLDNGINFIYR